MSMDGSTYAADPMPNPVVAPGDFVFAATHLDHSHINGMSEGLIGGGATLKWVYDSDPAKVEAFRSKFPDVRVARSESEVLDDPDVKLVAGAAIPSERSALGLRVMDAGKDYFTDKAPMTTLDQLESAREATARTGMKYAVCYSERVHVEAAVLAGQLIERGAIGDVVQVMGMGPHRVGGPRPDWFYDKEQYGGILCDIGSHNFEQMLFFTGARDGQISSSSIANYSHPEHPELDDFGDAHVAFDNGTSGYVRVDWLTPSGLRAFGDGRTFLLGTDGYIELRKYVNIATEDGPGNLFLVNGDGEQRINATGKVGYPFFGQLILDCIDRTENAMTQEHAFKAAELSLRAQAQAVTLTT